MLLNIIKIITLVNIIFIFGCHDDSIINDQGLELYILKDEIKISNDNDLKTVSLPEVPLLSMKDISSYHWCQHAHEISLTPDGWKKIRKYLNEANFRISGQIFIISLDRQPIYFGRLISIYDSEMPDSPVIDLEELEQGRLVISGYEKFEEIINNADLYNWLMNKNLLVKPDTCI